MESIWGSLSIRI